MNYNTSLDLLVRDYILKYLRAQSIDIIHTEFSSRSEIEIANVKDSVFFHYALQGELNVYLNGSMITLTKGELLILPSGIGHCISDGQCREGRRGSGVAEVANSKRVKNTNDLASVELTKSIFGVVKYDKFLLSNLNLVFNEYFKLDIVSNELDNIVGSLFAIMACESEDVIERNRMLLPRLFDTIVAAIVNCNFIWQKVQEKKSAITIKDERIKRILYCFLNEPGEYWSIEDLSSLAGMSRTSFIQKFKEEVGMPPMDYLSKHRMSLAFSKLKYDKEKVISVAFSVGYKSEAAFSRAFKKSFGLSPTDVIHDRNSLNNAIKKIDSVADIR